MKKKIHLFRPKEIVSYCNVKFNAGTEMTILVSKTTCQSCLAALRGKKVWGSLNNDREFKENYWPQLEEVD